MGLFQNIIVAILSISFVVFCALFGSLPRLRRTPIGFINQLIWIQIPGLLFGIDRLITGGRSAKWLKASGNYLMNTNHPLVFIFFLLTVFSAQAVFLPVALPRLTPLQHLPTIFLCLAPYPLAFLTAFSTTHHITPTTHASQMSLFPYDHVLFHPGVYCPTCRLLKPARSKHCRICNMCVSKHDHHCIWVRTCLGRGNYHYFLLMLLSLGAMLIYGAYLAYGLLDATIQARFNERNPGWADTGALRRWSAGKSWGQAGGWWSWAFGNDIRVGATGLLAAFTAPLALGLLAYHAYLIWAGTTTNESFKWEEWKEDVQDGYVYRREAEEGEVRRKESDAGGVGAQQVEPYVDWPASSRQRLVSRANKVSLERELEQGQNLGQEPWVQVQDMAEVVNLYDLGFWENLKDVFRY